MKFTLPEFRKGKVLVVGDVMLDRYWIGNTERISPEAPVPVVHVQQVEDRPGGAGNVAVNVATLGGTALLMGVVGEDEAGDTLSRLLRDKGVECHLYADPSVQTSTKLRILSRHQQLLRADFESSLALEEEKDFLDKYTDVLQNAGAVVFSDYGKGTLFRVEKMINIAREEGVPVLVDPKRKDFSIYKGATIVTPNRSEFEAVVGKCENIDVLIDKAEQLRIKLSFDAILITQGEEGMTLVRKNGPPLHLNANARDVYDVTGAGDTVIATLAAGIASGAPMELAMNAANIAAGIVVGRVGTATVSLTEMKDAL